MNRTIPAVTRFERVFHWTFAASFVLLILSGFEIRYGGGIPLTDSLATAFGVHDAAAHVLVTAYGLWLIYLLFTRRIGLFVPSRFDGGGALARQLEYYVNGIFAGARYPFSPRPENKFNPVQKVSYLAVMGAIVPVQIVTGLYLMVSIRNWMAFDSGELLGWSHVHVAVGFIGAAFVLVHLYMITTSPAPLADLASMVTGDKPVHGAE